MKTIIYFTTNKTVALCARIFDDSVGKAERKACIGELDKEICKMNNLNRETMSNTEMAKIRCKVFSYHK